MKRKLGLFIMFLVSLFTLVCFNVKVSADGANYAYVKVTETPDDWSGDYLIVYVAGGVIFDGGLSTLDATNNNKAVTITDNQILGDSDIDSRIFTISKNGSYYSIKSKSGFYIGNTTDTNKLNSSTTTKHTNTISLNDDGSIHIVGSGGSILRYNANSGNYRFRYFKSGTYTNQKAIHLFKYTELENSDVCECSNFIEEEAPSVANKKSDATCTTSAVYYKVCSECGKKNVDETYYYGDPLGHSFDEFGLCSKCEQYDSSLSIDERVVKLFNHFYNEGTYTKESVLNVSKTSMEDIKTYFHAGASIRYRKTSYTPGQIAMVVSEDGVSYDNDTLSKYFDDNGKVSHTGNGNNYTVNWTSVEDKFVTLLDFIENGLTGWIYDDGIYTYSLNPTTATVEHEMTRLAREFVAPMWLAPNSSNYNYVIFSKLTVQVINGQLVMSLYAEETNKGNLLEEAQSSLIFSQVTISPVVTNFETLATFEFGDNGSAAHNDGNDLSTSKSYVEGSYTLNLTEMSKVYGPAYDATGNSCLKLGTSSVVGTFTFVVPSDVNTVVIYVAGYKANKGKITINGTEYSIDTVSNNGEYTAITIDTSQSQNKTVIFSTVSGYARCMINTIEFK